MRRCLIFFIIVLCSGCSIDHENSMANLTYKKVLITPSGYGYEINFLSDTDLLSLLDDSLGDDLVCSLDDDVDFSIGHYLKRSGRGSVRSSSEFSGLEYESTVIFRAAGDVQGQETILGKKELRKYLTARDFVLCVYRVNNNQRTDYFSQPMRIPAKDFLRGIDK